MARYAEYADVEIAVDDSTLVRLTDDNGFGDAQESVVEQFLEAAADQINGKIGMRYPLPIADPPSILKSWNVDICVYYLFGRRNDEAGEVWTRRYEDAVNGLNAIATGKMSLGLGDPQGTGVRLSVASASSDRMFSRDKMRGF